MFFELLFSQALVVLPMLKIVSLQVAVYHAKIVSSLIAVIVSVFLAMKAVELSLSDPIDPSCLVALYAKDQGYDQLT